MTEIPFYNHLGEISLVLGVPSFVNDDCVPVIERQSLINNVSHVLNKKPTTSLVRAASGNLTLEVKFDDDSSVIARKILPRDNSAKDNWRVQKLRIEARLLVWFDSRSSRLPIPRLLSPIVDSPLNEPDPNLSFFFVTEKLPGTILLNQYGYLDTLAKECTVQSFANFALEMFNLKVPQKIGSFVPGISSTSSDDVVPGITVQSYLATEAFDNIREYFDFLLEMKKHSHTIGGDDHGHLDELRVHINTLLDNLTSKKPAHSLLRCVLAHEDLNDMNILVDERGRITGVVDWEYQLIKPAILAAEYPPWLCYDACLDPRFADQVYTLWLESPEESERLRNLYLQTVKARDEEYYEALVQGAKLRSCARWLTYIHAVDEGCVRMKQWMDFAFSSSSSSSVEKV